ncbi:MAG: response regulator, partial [Candidatus Rokubacteria bacterium]|nr:response regulator [Candidatus Rokubacteria bacterium]
LQPDGSLLAIAAGDPSRAHSWLGHVLPSGMGISGRVVAARGAIQCRDVLNEPDFVLTDEMRRRIVASGDRAFLAVPLRVKTEIIGVLSVADRGGRLFSEAEVALLQAFADQAALAIRNAQMFAREQEARTQAEVSEQRFRGLVQDLDAIVWEADAVTWQFAFVSQRAEAILGCPVEQWLTEPEFWVNRLHPDDRERTLALRCAAISEGRDSDLEYRCVAADGCVVWLRDRVRVVRDASGQARQLRGVMVDITQRKRLQEDLTQAEKLATLGEMIAGIAHELNNPLAALTGHAQLLRTEHRGAATEGRVERLLQAAQRASRVVQNFLTFARKHRPETVAVSVNDVITKTLEFLAYQLRVNNIEVQTALTPDLPFIAADPHQLQQVLVNLLNNASQAMATAGRGTLRVVSGLNPDGATIGVTVGDDGPGIPPESLSRIFDPFFTTKSPGEGTGLGLAIARGIVTEHGGTITVESELGEGATFVVTLPIPQISPVPRPPVEPRAIPTGLRVLVVDDEESLRELIADALADQGNRVETTAEGREALELLAGSPVDVLVLDVRMPGMSGTDLWTEINRTNPLLARRTVFCTGSVVGEKTRTFLDSTGCPTVAKPFELSHLFDAVARAASQ